MLSSMIHSIVLNPPWNVPQSIATKELWPKERASPGYFARNDFIVIPTEGGGYTMDHTASIYLLDGEGRLRGFLDNHEPIATAVAKLRLALHGPAGAAAGSTS